MSVTDQTDTKVKTGFVENEPVVVGHFVLWLLMNLGALIVGHTHLFTQTQWDSFTTGLVPFITAILLGIIATVMRKYVSPWWKKFQAAEVKAGFPALTTEQLAIFAEQLFEKWQASQVQNTPVEGSPSPVANPA